MIFFFWVFVLYFRHSLPWNVFIFEGSFTEQYDLMLQLAAKFRNSGQTCVCANRVLVQEGMNGKFSFIPWGTLLLGLSN